jgi:hypothetical protein
MENFERLSNKVLVVTCSCGVVFKTYDPQKMYHSNKCRTNYIKKRCEAKIVHNRKLKQKTLGEKTNEGAT